MRLQDVKGEVEWSALEAELLECAPLGYVASLDGKEDCPADTSDPDRRVRAGLIRWLLLGGNAGDGLRTHPKGLIVWGAWVEGELDFQSCKTRLGCMLSRCLFPDRVCFMDAEVRALYLPTSHCQKGLNLHRLKTETDVYMRDGFKATGLVDLGGARIGGQLDCTDGQFLNPGETALNGDAAQVGAGVFLRGGFKAEGMVNLIGAQIGGQLDCTSGQFLHLGETALDCDAAQVGADVFLSDGFKAKGRVNLRGARIGGQLDCTGGQFLNPGQSALTCSALQVGADVFLREGFKAEGMVDFVRAKVAGTLQIRQATLDGVFDGRDMTVRAGFFWQDVTGSRDRVNLRHASLGVLRDDKASWDGVGTLHLDGLSYDRIDSAMTVGERLAWLARKRERPMPFVHPAGPDLMPWLDLGDGFDPQPYTQLARVLTAAGNRSGAARMRRVREELLSQAEYRRSLARLDGSVRAGFVSLGGAMRRRWDVLFRGLFGYGHAPARVFWWIGGLVVLTAALFGHIYDMGQMAPNSAVVLTSEDWLAAVYWADPLHTQPMHIWVGNGAFAGMPSAIDYETFSRILYAFDLFIPLDAIGQQQAWAPSHDRGGWGEVGYWARAPIQVAGWVIAAVGAAVVTGLLGKKDDG